MAYPVIPTDDDNAFFAKSKVTDKALQKRMTMERMVIRKAARDLIAAGFQLRVWNGEGYECERTADLPTIMAAIMACDEESIEVYRLNAAGTGINTGIPGGWKRYGTIVLVYGNDGYDVIADNSVNLEEYLKGATELSDKLAG